MRNTTKSTFPGKKKKRVISSCVKIYLRVHNMNSHDVDNEAAGSFQADTVRQGGNNGFSISMDGDTANIEREREPLLPHASTASQIVMEMEEGNSNNVSTNVPSTGNDVRILVENARNERNVPSHFLSLFNQQLRRQRSIPRETFRPLPRPMLSQRSVPGVSPVGSIGSNATTDANGNVRSFWRMNLNDVLSFSTVPVPTPEAIRSLFTHSSNIRYSTLNGNELSNNASSSTIREPDSTPSSEHVNETQSLSNNLVNSGATSTSALRLNARGVTARSLSLREGAQTQADQLGSMTHGHQSVPTVFREDNDNRLNDTITRSQQLGVNRTNALDVTGGNDPNVSENENGGAQDNAEDDNVLAETFVKFISHFMRYLPFICILLVKFLHDHLLGILDLVILHFVMYNMNKSLRTQVAKLSQKRYTILTRDFCLTAFVVGYRIMLSSVPPDPLGLIVPPAPNAFTVVAMPLGTQPSPLNDESAGIHNNNVNQLSENNTINAPNTVPLDVLLYYVAISDIILRLLAILIKIAITMLPVTVLRHKAKGRVFVLVEYFSQFYRALAPYRQWILFLFDSYSGLEVISGMLFCFFYTGAKCFEFIERGKSLKKAFENCIRNVDAERKPTKAELETAGSQCPICHDTYNSPIILECNHIFCDDCVGTWFKREQTCPMCRAKVGDDPIWQDGATTFFYQLF